MKILGIDPGLATIGISVVDGQGPEVLYYGVIETDKKWNYQKRLKYIHSSLKEIIEKWQPDAAAVEKLFFNKNVKTAMQVAEARGIILLTLFEAELSVGEYTPIEVKQAVTGYGNAKKEQVQKMVSLIFELDAVPQPDDAADAVAIAYCHIGQTGSRKAAKPQD